MDIESVSDEKTVFVIGAPRSGTTWLGKIFDSNPMVLYRHEPDTLIANQHIPRVAVDEDLQAHVPAARAYLDAMVRGRFLKASGTLPVFRKAYRSGAMHAAYVAMIMALRIAQKASGDVRRMRQLLAPDMVDPAMAADVSVVIKSILSRGRTRLFTTARPGMRVVLILRDPFGQVASMLRGVSLGKFDAEVILTDCLDTPQAKAYGLSKARFDRMSAIEQYAWHWALLNEKALDDLDGHPHARVVRYRDLVEHPDAETQALFAFAGLDWQAQTERFLRVSTTSNLPDSYYQVYKNSQDSLNKWRRQLTCEQQRQIVSVVSQTDVWARYPEFHDMAQ